MICVTIIDRDEAEADLAEQSLRMLTASRTNEVLKVNRYSMAEDYAHDTDRREPVHMALIDVSACGGIEAAAHIRNKYRNAQILLMADRTISPEYYVQSSVGACYLILRPGSIALYRKKIREMFEGYLRAAPEYEIWIRGDHGMIRLPLEEILYFETMKRGVCVHTESGPLQFRDTLAGLENRLGDERFFRCHRFYLVNRQHIHAVRLQRGNIQLTDGTLLPLGKTYHQMIRDRIEWEMAQLNGSGKQKEIPSGIGVPAAQTAAG